MEGPVVPPDQQGHGYAPLVDNQGHGAGQGPRDREQCNLLQQSLDPITFFRLFAFFQAFKFVLGALILLVISIGVKSSVEGTVSLAQCTACLAKSRLPENADTLFEFGKCSEDFFPEVQGENLLQQKSLFDLAGQSQVQSLVVLSVFVMVGVLILATLYLKLACSIRQPDTTFTLLLMYINFLVVVILLNLSNSVFLLTERDGCFIGVVSPEFLYAQMCLLVLFLLLACASGGYEHGTCTVVTILCTIFVLFVYTILSVILGAMNWWESGSVLPAAFVAIAFVSTFEMPTFLFSLKFLSEYFGIEEDPLAFDEIH